MDFDHSAIIIFILLFCFVEKPSRAQQNLVGLHVIFSLELRGNIVHRTLYYLTLLSHVKRQCEFVICSSRIQHPML